MFTVEICNFQVLKCINKIFKKQVKITLTP